ncbi:acetylglutamate kinase [Polluticoccus soli]|uniref:acetylglutamate kinase n=1 Tax=Polluticoccus soli TaxID=3034150 RepID=UPI0023E1C5AC|nr:acetylglutamate kinase [Flavipsychrobacter sp. JY13-12]
MEQLIVVKIGGNIIDDEAKLSSFLQSFSQIKEKKILVHGGGKIATTIGNKLGIESKYHNGRRITDVETLDLVTMVYGGLINKKIVARLQALQCNAIGLTGTDGNILAADKRLVGEVDFGYVGDVKKDGVNGFMLAQLLNTGLTPVLAPLTHDCEGTMLNTNADTIAQKIAEAMADIMPVKLVYCFEKKGLLSDVNDGASVIANINQVTYNDLKADGTISGGMIPKVENALAAVRTKVSRVIIGHADDLDDLIAGKTGTQIQ